MSIESRERTPHLTCPLCGGQVAAGSSGCQPCHLPMSDVLRHGERPRRLEGRRRAAGVRFTGLVLYAGVVAWAWWQLPQTLPFVVLGAGLGGGVLHVWKGRPWLGLIVFALVVVIVPRLLWSAFGMGALSDLAERF